MESSNAFLVLLFLCSLSLNIFVGATKCVPLSKFHIDCMPCYCSETGEEYSCIPRICDRRHVEDMFTSHIDKDGRTILTPKKNINHLTYDYQPLPYAVNPYDKTTYLQAPVTKNEGESVNNQRSEDNNLESLFKSADQKSQSNDDMALHINVDSLNKFRNKLYESLNARKTTDEEEGLREDDGNDDNSDDSVINFS